MKQVYLAYAMTNSSQYLDKINALADFLRNEGLKVIQPSFSLFPELVVQRTMNEIQKSDLIIADLSICSHGVGFELGYSYSLNKGVILMVESEKQNSVSKFIYEVFNTIVIYTDSKDLVQKIKSLIYSDIIHSGKKHLNIGLLKE